MYEKFTDRARKVMQLANQEALRFNHEYIGTEHILLGLIAEGSGVAANALKNLDVDLLKVRQEVEKIVAAGPDIVVIDRLPLTPRAKKVLEFATEEARGFDHNYVGTEHLLLGLIREVEGVAAQVLMNLGLRLGTLRKEVKQLLGHDLPVGDVQDLPSPIVVTKKKTESLPRPARKILAEFDWQIESIRERKAEAVDGGQFEKAAALRDLEDKLAALRIDFLQAWPEAE